MPTNAITKTSNNQLKNWLDSPQFKTQLDRLLPKHIAGERFVRIALNAAMNTPKLADCSKASVFKCLLDLAAMGIEPNGRDAHLIPFEDRRAGVTTCTLVVDYKGLVQCVRRAPGVVDIQADVVCENDDFEFSQGGNKYLKHSFAFGKPRGKVVGAYSYVTTTEGDSFEVMTLEEIEEVRRASRSGNSGPWKTHFGEMAKKTVFRRHTKWLPLPSEVSSAIEAADSEKPDKASAAFVDIEAAEASATSTPPVPNDQDGNSDDELPMNFENATPGSGFGDAEPTKPAKTRKSAPPRKPETAEPEKTAHYTPKDVDALESEFMAILEKSGASFDDFLSWGKDSGMLEDADSIGSVEDFPPSTLKRFVGAKAGLLAQLMAKKGVSTE